MARQVKCNYKMCNNLGIAVEPIKYKNKYYCKTCLEKLQKEEEEKVVLREKENKIKARKAELRKKIMDTVLEILPLEIPSLINKSVTQWVDLGYPMEYILYTTEHIKLNKCVLNHVQGIRYYMNNDEIKKRYKDLKVKSKLKQMDNQDFGITDEVVKFTPVQDNSNWSDLV